MPGTAHSRADRLLRALSVTWFLGIASLSVAALPGTPSMASPPSLVLEASETIHSQGADETRLLLRVLNDGTVEWDDYANESWRLRRRSVTSDQVVRTQRLLAGVNVADLRDNLGPYYEYVDTNVAVVVTFQSAIDRFSFTMRNPWTGLFVNRAMPAEVRAITCEIDGYRHRLVKTESDLQCRPPTHVN